MKVDISATYGRIVTTVDVDDEIEALAKDDELWDSDRDTITTKLGEIIDENGVLDDVLADFEVQIEFRDCELSDEQWDTYQAFVAAEQQRRRNIGQYDIFGGMVGP